MAFTPTTWVDGSAPAITAAQLNRIETGISEAWGAQGSWTPTLAGGTFTYVDQIGRYVRQGNLALVRFSVSWSALSGTGSALYVESLPYELDPDWQGALGQLAFIATTVAFPTPSEVVSIGFSAANIDRLQAVFATDAGLVGLPSSYLPASGQLRGSIAYVTDEAW